jgi:hypothetical protein
MENMLALHGDIKKQHVIQRLNTLGEKGKP